jgi:hypothetical protein
MTRPQRMLTRVLLGNLVRQAINEGPPLFPLAKKPHQYYY